ncbi:type II secretion system protein F (GspF) [Labedella gwakjiensis]|uniref:Type II secretion system protein F n=1 Tax=Labedella gwakjiensis TaxID=390269 RepID=A0A2P8H0X9_9MICO|nr:type II secretion system F family protein [Labedella gwakjiensis]PSL39866.1 type II secretion system protein F (GspF) [Labedella gwakjiensis]RUQ85764.1 type II secretion system protein F [Labedella gwakjiensis]
MTWVLGAMLGAGLVLSISPRLWPARRRERSGRDRWAPVRARLALAGLGRVPIPAFVLVSLIVGLLLAGAALLVTSVPLVGVLTGVVGTALPWILVSVRAAGRRRERSALWPDVVDHLVAAARSGLAVPDAVGSLGRQGPEDLRPEFRAFARDYASSASWGGALDRLKATLDDPVADRVLETLRMAREVGGADLTAILRQLSAALRDDAATRAELDARQSWVRNAAKLGVAAPWLILFLLSTRPEAAAAYAAPEGTALILAGAAVSVFAYRLMLMVGRLPAERRWFR